MQLKRQKQYYPSDRKNKLNNDYNMLISILRDDDTYSMLAKGDHLLYLESESNTYIVLPYMNANQVSIIITVILCYYILYIMPTLLVNIIIIQLEPSINSLSS